MRHFQSGAAAAALLLAPLTAQGATVEIMRIGAHTSWSGAGNNIASRSNQRIEGTDVSGAANAKIEVGVVPFDPDRETNYVRGNAFQNDQQISRAGLEMALAYGRDVTDQSPPDINFVSGLSSTTTWLKVTNDTNADDRLFYEFALSGMLLEMQYGFSSGPNPIVFPSTNLADANNYWEAEAELNSFSGARAVRVDFVIYQLSKYYDDPNSLDFGRDILDFRPFENYGFESEFYAAYEMYQTIEFDPDGFPFVKRTVTESENLSGERTDLCDGDPPFCYGTRIDIAPTNGVIDLGMFAPGQSDTLLIYSRAIIVSNPFETYALARIGDPGDLNSGASGRLYSANGGGVPVGAVPLPASLVLLLGGLGALRLMRRRAA